MLQQVVNRSFGRPFSNNKLDTCTHCCVAQSKKQPFFASSFTATAPLELVHCDVWGPAPILSKHYFAKPYVSLMLIYVIAGLAFALKNKKFLQRFRPFQAKS